MLLVLHFIYIHWCRKQDLYDSAVTSQNQYFKLAIFSLFNNKFFLLNNINIPFRNSGMTPENISQEYMSGNPSKQNKQVDEKVGPVYNINFLRGGKNLPLFQFQVFLHELTITPALI